MSIHDCFASNLRDECNRIGSISNVCSGIGINRQQFNKYLSGKSLPNEQTLRRICSFLKIQKEQLFSLRQNNIPLEPAAARGPSPHLPDIGSVLALVNTLTQGAVKTASDALQPGEYYCYFPLQETSHYLMRTLLVVRRLPEGLTFSRLTVFPSDGTPHRFLARSRHQGIVTANATEIHFVGINESCPNQVSFLTFERPPGPFRHYFTGLAIVRTTQEPMAARVCLQYLGTPVTS